MIWFSNYIFIYFYSLYPAITLDEDYQFPIGDGEVLKSPEEISGIKIEKNEMLYKNQPIEGLIFLKILPPKDLIPFLLSRIDGKALAVCCQKCAETKNERLCTHDQNERSIVGVYCINEIVYAVQHYKYEIMQIFEIYAFTQRAQVFKNFMTFLGAKKIRHSNYPKNIKTDEDKQAYCDYVNKKMKFDPSISITPENIDNNEYQKQATKNGLNSVLGRFNIICYVSN